MASLTWEVRVIQGRGYFSSLLFEMVFLFPRKG